MSLVVFCGGRRANLRLSSPNQLMQSVLEEAAKEFSLDPKGYVLLYKRGAVDASQPFNLSGLTNNAQLELVSVRDAATRLVPKSGASAGSADVRIALSTPTGERLMENFPRTTSLWALVEHFQQTGQLTAGLLPNDCEMIYLRSSFSGEVLSTVTLESLGLAGKSAKFNLKYSAVSGAGSCPTPTDTADSTNSVRADEVPVDTSIVRAPAAEDTLDTNSAQMKGPTTVEGQQEEATECSANQKEVDSSTSGGAFSHIPETMNQESAGKQDEEVTMDIVEEQQRYISPREALDNILTTNFDVVTVPALVTIVKYIHNILRCPSEEKFRSISVQSKAFREKVLPAKGSVDFLLCIGFDNNAVPDRLVINDDNSILDELQKARLLLELVLAEELHVPEEDRPKYVAPVTSESEESTNVNSFDPYKSMMLSTAPQPVRIGESKTELMLAQLEKRRMELEGDKADVDRCTEAIFPRADGSTANMQDYLIDSSNTASDDNADSNPVSKDLVKKIMSSAKGEDDTPLTTKAFRDLQKAQKAKVYSKSLIRVKFPDRVCLQAFFHPRHTIFEVYKWVYENIKQPALGVGQTEISLGDFYSVFSADQLFELYVSPPKQVFPAIPPSNGGSKYSLADLQLQPAAVLLLSWKENSSLYQQLATTGLITSAAAASASAGNITIGNYLQEGLLAVAEEKGHTRTLGNIKSSSSMNYPVGDSLSSVGNSLAGGVGSLMGSMKSIFGSSKEDAQSDADNKKSAASKKPKWFKI